MILGFFGELRGTHPLRAVPITDMLFDVVALLPQHVLNSFCWCTGATWRGALSFQSQV